MAGGAEELNRLAVDLGKAGALAFAQAAVAVSKTAHNIEATSKALAPVDTGNLRNSIGVDRSMSGMAADIGPTANYGGHVEYGTTRTAPQAYMGPALDRHGWELDAAIAKIADTAL